MKMNRMNGESEKEKNPHCRNINTAHWVFQSILHINCIDQNNKRKERERSLEKLNSEKYRRRKKFPFSSLSLSCIAFGCLCRVKIRVLLIPYEWTKWWKNRRTTTSIYVHSTLCRLSELFIVIMFHIRKSPDHFRIDSNWKKLRFCQSYLCLMQNNMKLLCCVVVRCRKSQSN